MSGPPIYIIIVILCAFQEDRVYHAYTQHFGDCLLRNEILGNVVEMLGNPLVTVWIKHPANLHERETETVDSGNCGIVDQNHMQPKTTIFGGFYYLTVLYARIGYIAAIERFTGKCNIGAMYIACSNKLLYIKFVNSVKNHFLNFERLSS